MLLVSAHISAFEKWVTFDSAADCFSDHPLMDLDDKNNWFFKVFIFLLCDNAHIKRWYNFLLTILKFKTCNEFYYNLHKFPEAKSSLILRIKVFMIFFWLFLKCLKVKAKKRNQRNIVYRKRVIFVNIYSRHESCGALKSWLPSLNCQMVKFEMD